VAVCVLDVDLLVRKLHQKLAKLQKDSTNVCVSGRKDFDRGIIGEKLESMKKSKRIPQQRDNLQGELGVLLQDVSNYEKASEKKELQTRLLRSAWNFVKGIFPRCHAKFANLHT